MEWPRDNVAQGMHMKAATSTCYAFLGGSFATLATVCAVGYLSKRSYENAQAAEERNRLEHFREALGVTCLDSVILSPTRMDTCKMDTLLYAIEKLRDRTLDELELELRSMLSIYPKDLRRIEVFQSNVRLLMEEPLSSFAKLAAGVEEVICRKSDFSEVRTPSTACASQVSSCSGVNVGSLLNLRNTQLDVMEEKQKKTIAELAHKQAKLRGHAEFTYNRLRQADDAGEIFYQMRLEIRLIELAQNALDGELAQASIVGDDLDKLQQLHIDFVNWLLAYRAWKSSQGRIAFAESEDESEEYRSSCTPSKPACQVVQMDITEPDNLAYEVPPPGYDTKLLLRRSSVDAPDVHSPSMASETSFCV